MAMFTIRDLTGSAQLDVDDDSVAGKINLTSLQTAASKVLAALPKPVTDPTFQDATFAAAFEKRSIPLAGNTGDIQASVNSTFSVARFADTPLFGKDNFDGVDIHVDECWVGFELDASLDANVAVPLPQGFGVSFDASAQAGFATYLLIPAAEAPNTTLATALSKSVSRFRILASVDDVLALPAGVICTSDLMGSVAVAGSWSLPLAVNQLSLADAQLPFNANISVAPSASVKVGGSITITSEFSVRFRRTGADLIRIGLYKKKGKTLAASFVASAGLGANLGNTDLIAAFFNATASTFDLSSLPPADVAKIRKVLTDSLNHSLSISLNAACSASDTDEAAIVYELDTAAGDKQETHAAIGAALHGDWTALAGLREARVIRNVIVESVEKKIAFSVNFLGLYNYRSVSDFVRTMRVVANAEDGSVVVTDTATAKRITTASAPLSADADKLRAALYEAFLATVTYKALGAGLGTRATFGARQDLLIYKDKMDYRKAVRQLHTGEVLGVLPPALLASLPPAGGTVHHARFAASATYSNDDVLRFFFSDIQALTPRNSSDLKRLGRSVLVSLLDARDAVDLERIAKLSSDKKWADMDSHPATIPAPFSSDWLDITTWAEAVAAVAPVLADTIRYGRTVQGDPAADAKFMDKRHKVALAIDGVTHNTKAAFDPAFPICVMTSLAGDGRAAVFEAAWDGRTLFSNA